MTEKIDLKNLDKSTWQKVKFSDIAINVRKTSKNPLKDGFTKAIGLGHIEPDNLNLLGYTDIAKEGTKFNKIFRKGQFLFGSRRAYLRQMARATFDGVCTANIMVFDVKDENLINRDLFEFIIRSDSFINCAINTSEGSLFPNAKWKYIAEYEFLLPPKDQQAQLAKLLWAMSDVIEKENELLNRVKQSYETLINQFMIHGNYVDGQLIKTKCGLLDSRIETYKLKDCLSEKPMYGANASSKPYEMDSPRYIRITDIDDEGNLIKEDKVTIDSSDYEQYVLSDNDFLFARTGNTVGKTLLYKNEMGNAVFAGYLIKFDINEELLNPKFLFYFTKSLKYESFKRKMIKVGAQPNINSEEYQSMVLPKFSLQVQNELCKKLDDLKSNIDLVNAKISGSKSLQKSLINQVF